MPYKCAAPGCRNENSSKCAVFSFPSDEKLCLKWRVNMNRGQSAKEKHVLWKNTKYSKLCQEHFTDDCFQINPRVAADIGFKINKLLLKADAVPTVFFGNKKSTPTGPVRGAYEKRKRQEILRNITNCMFTNEKQQTPSSASENKPENEVEEIYTAVPVETYCNFNGQENIEPDNTCPGEGQNKRRWRHRSSQTPMTWRSKLPVPVKSSYTQTRPETREQGVQTDPCDMTRTCDKQPMDESFHSENMDMVEEDTTDEDYLPGMEFDNSDDDDDDDDDQTCQTNHGDIKYIVYESQLKQLLSVCRFCSVKSNQISKKTCGTLVTFETLCEVCENKFCWTSQPTDDRMPPGNLLLSASILFSGSSPVKALNMLKFYKIAAFTMKTYYNIQNCYLLPSINTVWERQQQQMLQAVSGPLRLGGDARCCSPGHSAKYGSYSLMDIQQSKILDMQLVQCNEVANSNAMELEGLKRCLSKLADEGIEVSDITTDRHPQVKKYLREQHPTINHWFDVWHVAKGVKKKIEVASKRKGCEVLGRWAQSLSNHLYYCAASSDGNGEVVVAKWKSVLNHVADKHDGHGPLFPSCLHGPLDDREWIKNGSKPHKELTEIVERQGLVRDIKKLSPSDQTYSLESFHKICCFFATKFVHFFYCSMEGRLKLAALHFNENSNREQCLNRDGSLRWQISRPKYKHGNPTAKEMKVALSYEYVDNLMEEVWNRRQQYQTYRQSREELKPYLMSTPRPVSSTYEVVDKQAIIEAHRTRFSSIQ